MGVPSTTIKKNKTGTREWSDISYNIGVGCSHACRYCFASCNALRYGFIKNAEEWTQEKLKPKLPRISHWAGKVVMFPTTHDITPFYLEQAVTAIRLLMQEGNRLLIVSKPHMECIKRLCQEMSEYTNYVLFRFSIGTLNEKLSAFWEPGAPSSEERVSCLRYAFEQGFSTSVSMEPFLGSITDAIRTFKTLSPFVTDRIWIGKMNHIELRVRKTTPQIVEACQKITKFQSDENILKLVKHLSGNEKVAWKDSIKALLNENPPSNSNSIPSRS